MLKLYQQFIRESAVRSPHYLLTPPILEQSKVVLPRFSSVHYLDSSSANHFPTRDLYYFNQISKEKRIPIHTVNELVIKSDTVTLKNKQYIIEVKRWEQNNRKVFRSVDLTETPNTDTNVISIYNYNLLKDLYSYKTSLLSKYFRTQDLYKTYWYGVKQAIQKDPEAYQFVAIDLPNYIPSYKIMENIAKLPLPRYARVVTDKDLDRIVDLFKWLTGSKGNSSSMTVLSDQDSTKIVLELKYKAHSCFLPLSLLRALDKNSELDSAVKVDNGKILRTFVLFLLNIQKSVNAKLDGTNSLDELTLVYQEDEVVNTLDSDIEEDENPGVQPNPELMHTGLTDTDKQYLNRDINSVSKDQQSIQIDSVDGLFGSFLDKMEASSNFDESLFEETLNKASGENDEEETSEQPLVVNYDPEYTKSLLTDKNQHDVFNKFLESAVKNKTMSSAELRSLRKMKETRDELVSPYDRSKKLDVFKVITEEEKALTGEKKKLPITNNLVSDDFKEEVVNTFDRQYVKHTLKKDVVACVSQLEKAGLIIKNYEIEPVRNSLGAYEVHKLTIKPLDGKESTVYFRLPIIDKEGEFASSGIRYMQRKQKTDLPIRKISPTKVALTSNYSKLFVFRTERKSYDPYAYLVGHLQNSYINGENNILKVIPGKKKLNEQKLPNLYYTLASEFNEVHTDKITLLLNQTETNSYIDDKVSSDIKSKGLIFCGYLPNKHIVVMDDRERLFDYTEQMSELPSIYELTNINEDKLPKPFTMMKVLGDNIPLGVCLAYYLGLDNLLAVTKTEFRLLEANKIYRPIEDELVLKFGDYKLILTLDSVEKQLLFNGFLYYKDFIKSYNLEDFKLKNVYLNMLEFRDAGLIHLKELTLLEEMFLDPITVDVLQEMKEPTDYLQLLLKANKLLEDLYHKDIHDTSFVRLRGYDRVPGLMYRALTESVRDYKIKGRRNTKIELDPYKVWNYIVQDSTVKITEDINPVLDIKEAETVTLSGMDGLNKDATPKMLRRYHKNDMGFISEATVDSSDVALNMYLSPYAKIKNTRGLIDVESEAHVKNPAKVFSTSILCAPMSEYDDVKRMNFISIQNSHSIMALGSVQPTVRTGYEYVVPYKAGRLYSVMAEQDGMVVEKSDKLITVKYKEDGVIETFKIGTQYGRMEGSVYPHNVITTLKKGDKFKAGEPLAYNENFFEPDWLDPKRIIMKTGSTITVALSMTKDVFEDSSAISKRVNELMATPVVKEKIFILDFNKHILTMLPEGSETVPDSILFTAADTDTDYGNLSESTISMLQNLASVSPRAKYNGVVERYEIKYNGELSDMSPSLRKLANKLDRQLYDETKGTEYEASNNRVNSEYRSEGKNLNLDTVELKVFIRVLLKQNVGDKGVFANQMKSVISDVFEYNISTPSGEVIDAKFGYKGILNRIVNSPILIGTTNRLSKHASKKAAEVYFGS